MNSGVHLFFRVNPAVFYWSGWWLAVFPGLAITLTVLSINFFGDALRDILDVREQLMEG